MHKYKIVLFFLFLIFTSCSYGVATHKIKFDYAGTVSKTIFVVENSGLTELVTTNRKVRLVCFSYLHEAEIVLLTNEFISYRDILYAIRDFESTIRDMGLSQLYVIFHHIFLKYFTVEKDSLELISDDYRKYLITIVIFTKMILNESKEAKNL